MAATHHTQHVAHIRVGYLRETLGDITIGPDGQPRFTGANAAAVRALYASVTHQPRYQGLALSQTLAQMAANLRAPTWSVVVSD